MACSSLSDELRTVRVDPRYPFTNQTRACYDNYCYYHRCTRVLGDEDTCAIIKHYYSSVCPKAWVSHWDELREKGAFPGPI